MYSPETCCFVELWLNNLFTDSGSARGEYPIGVCFDKSKNKFKAQISIDGKNTSIGYYGTPEEAHPSYLKAKKDYIVMKMIDYPNQRIKEAVLRKGNV